MIADLSIEILVNGRRYKGGSQLSGGNTVAGSNGEGASTGEQEGKLIKVLGLPQEACGLASKNSRHIASVVFSSLPSLTRCEGFHSLSS